MSKEEEPNRKDTMINLSSDYCQFQAKSKGGLKRHITVQHNKPSLKLTCDKCDYTSEIKWDLRKHLMSKHETFLHSSRYCDYTTEETSTRSSTVALLHRFHKSSDFNLIGVGGGVGGLKVFTVCPRI